MIRPALAAALLLLPLAAAAAEPEVRLDAGAQPALSGEASVNLFGVSTWRAPDRGLRYRDLYVKAELSAGLRVAEGLSLHGVLKFEPLAGGPSTTGDGAIDRAFQDQGAFAESLFAEWQPTSRLTLRAGKFTAPFGTGHEDFPGIRLRDFAEAYEIAEGLGFGATLAVIEEEDGLGTHRLSAAVFTLDTTSLSSSFVTRRRFGRDEAERFARNSRGQGGPGNTGRLDNWALALDGEGIGALPGFSYHLAVLSRGAGVDGTAREWGFAIGLRQEIRWTEDLTTTLFAEAVRFRNAGGRPRIEVATTDPATGAPDGTVEATTLAERRTLATLGARTGWGPWRATLAWQADSRRRSVDAVPRETYLEASVGRELGHGLALDIGLSRTRYAREGGGAGTADAALTLLSWRAEF
ncbi:hypothetical protein [Falsiroseomonas sp. CW058]|uniref:hypothetical protein n=1 Tax=Falsiroseomonas sp. CW058 TaxID=3388664 RepID=UPI003D318B7B